MARATATFKNRFWEISRILGHEFDTGLNPAGVSAATKAKLLTDFNAAYRRVYNLYTWEDAWNEGEITVTSGIVDLDDLDDARLYVLYTADPREDTSAVRIDGHMRSAGIAVGSYETLFAFWIPVCPDFDGTNDNAPVIACLRDAVMAYAEAAYHRRASQWATAGSREKDGDEFAAKLQEDEYERNEARWWLHNPAAR